jgi:hypothetical protein
MKLVAFIMAIIVLVLSCMPCMDEGVDMKVIKDKKELSKSHNQQEEDEDHSDACSPFCTCSCCSGFSPVYSFAAIATLFPACSTNYCSLYISSVIEISLPVWQPPQLAA